MESNSKRTGAQWQLLDVGDTMISVPPFTLSYAETDELIEKVSIAFDKTVEAGGN